MLVVCVTDVVRRPSVRARVGTRAILSSSCGGGHGATPYGVVRAKVNTAATLLTSIHLFRFTCTTLPCRSAEQFQAAKERFLSAKLQKQAKTVAGAVTTNATETADPHHRPRAHFFNQAKVDRTRLPARQRVNVDQGSEAVLKLN